MALLSSQIPRVSPGSGWVRAWVEALEHLGLVRASLGCVLVKIQSQASRRQPCSCWCTVTMLHTGFAMSGSLILPPTGS